MAIPLRFIATSELGRCVAIAWGHGKAVASGHQQNPEKGISVFCNLVVIVSTEPGSRVTHPLRQFTLESRGLRGASLDFSM